MKPLRVVLVILGIYALIHVATQSLRHAFVAFVEPKSVMHGLETGREEIIATGSLEALVQGYRDANEKIKEFERGKSAEELRELRFREDGPYHERELHEQAIRNWEERRLKLSQLHFYWWSGVGFFVAAIVCWRRASPWLAIGLFMVAFGEMIYWTMPELRFWSDGSEFFRLVVWKLAYSLAAILLLLIAWWMVIIPLLQAALSPARVPDRSQT